MMHIILKVAGQFVILHIIFFAVQIRVFNSFLGVSIIFSKLVSSLLYCPKFIKFTLHNKKVVFNGFVT